MFLNPPGYIGFNADVQAGSAPLTVTFSPAIYVRLKPVSYVWIFGDGFKSSKKNPTHTYTVGGDFDVELIVTFEDGSQSDLIQTPYIKIVRLIVSVLEQSGQAPFTTKFYVIPDLPENVAITSYDWNFSDGSAHATGVDIVHTFITKGEYSTDIVGGLTGTGTGGLTGVENLTEVDSSIEISATQPSIKYSNMFSCLGWIKKPLVDDQSTLICLAIADPYNNVIGVDTSIKFEIMRDGFDYRLLHLGSKSKLIGKTLTIVLNDGTWHCVAYECDNSGTMTFYVDGVSLPAEDGIGTDGIAFNKAHSVHERMGGGPVWAPYLYELSQSIYLYNWRYGKNFNLGQSWINSLVGIDKTYLNI
jgi:hypothetical protein